MAISDVLRKAIRKWPHHTSSNGVHQSGCDSIEIATDSNGYTARPVLSHSHTFNTYTPNMDTTRRAFRFPNPTRRTTSKNHVDGILGEELDSFQKNESKLERARSKKESKLERAKSKKENKEKKRSLKKRPVHMERMESFSWGSASGSGSGSGSAAGYRDAHEDWDKQSEISPGNTRNHSQVEGSHEVERCLGKSDLYHGQVGMIHHCDEPLAEMRRLML